MSRASGDGAVIQLQAPADGVTYCYRTIMSDRDGAVEAHFGSDDGLAVWLNGTNVLSKNVPRGVSPASDIASLQLREGTNHLLLKIHNLRGGHGFYFALPDAQHQVATGTERTSPQRIVDLGEKRKGVGKRFPHGDQIL